MPQQADARTQPVGLFLNLTAQRRVDFQAACGDQFGRLFVAEDTDQAEHIISQQRVDLLIIDLERFDRGIDLAALGQLIRHRQGAPVMLVCPFDTASWLAELMAFGPLDYIIAPASDAEVAKRLVARLHSSATSTRADADATRTLLAVRSAVQQGKSVV